MSRLSQVIFTFIFTLPSISMVHPLNSRNAVSIIHNPGFTKDCNIWNNCIYCSFLFFFFCPVNLSFWQMVLSLLLSLPLLLSVSRTDSFQSTYNAPLVALLVLSHQIQISMGISIFLSIGRFRLNNGNTRLNVSVRLKLEHKSKDSCMNSSLNENGMRMKIECNY